MSCFQHFFHLKTLNHSADILYTDTVIYADIDLWFVGLFL